MKKNYLLLLLFCLLGTWLSASATPKTVFFDNSWKNWSQPYVYLYTDGSGSGQFYAMTQLKDNIWYFYRDTGQQHVIFVSGQDSWGDQVGGGGTPALDDLKLYGNNPDTGLLQYENAPRLYGCWDGTNNWTDLSLTNVSGSVYKTETKTYPASGSVEFGFRIMANTDQKVWLNMGAVTLDSNGDVANFKNENNSDNCKISLPAGTQYHLEMNLPNNTLTLVVESAASTNTYSIKGTIFDGKNWNSNPMTENNGALEWTGTVQKGDFGIQALDNNGNQVKWIYSADANNYTISNTGEYSAATEGSGHNWSSSLVGEYTFSFNPSTMKLTVSGGSTPSVAKYYVKYSSDSWNLHEMAYNEGDGTYTYTMTNPSSGCELAMRTNDKDFWTDEADVNYIGGTKSFSMKGTSSKNIKFGEGLSGDYTLTYNPTAKTLTISGSSTPTPTPTAYYRLKTSEDNWSKYYTFTDKGNGTYELSLENPAEGLEMMVQNSSDGNNYFDFCWPSSEDKNYLGGEKTFTMSGAYGENVTFGAGLSGTYTLTLTPNTTDSKQSTLKISGNAVVVTTYDDVYLTGSFNSWNNSDPSYKFTTTDGKIYTLTGVNIESEATMKVRKNKTNYGYNNATVESSVSKGENDGFGGQNIKLTQALSDATITVDFSGEKPIITIVNPKSVYLRGDFTETAWTDNAAYKFSTTDGKIYTLSGVNIANGKKMKIYYDGKYYGYDAAKVSKPLKSDGTDDSNMLLYADLIDATLTFDITDAENWKLTVDNNKDAYLRGDFTDPNWSNNDAYKFSTTDNVTYVLEHVNLDNGKLLKVYCGGIYYGHDSGKVTGPVNSADNYNMQLTEQLKDATITFTMPTPYADNWTLSIVNGAEVEHKAYYFAGDMNRWYSKKFDGDDSAHGIDAEIFAAEKGNWQFEYVGEVEGQTEKGWYKYVFDKNKIGMSTLVGQFQIIDDSGWSGSQYSNNPKTNDYSDASGFARYICRPITRDMISNGTVMTKETSAGKPGIIQQAGSNFHLDCNGVNNAVIYFLPGSDPKMIVKGYPTDYFIFYSAHNKSGGDGAVSMKIVNGKPNTNNYYLPGVQGLQNYTSENASTTAEHMNIAAVAPTLIDFSNTNFDSDDAFNKVFGNSKNVGDLTLSEFVNKIKTDKQLPNGIRLNGREEVYVIKIPNGFEYAAGRKFAVTFEKAFAAAEKETSSSIVANHLYFFNDKLHVLLNVDNYEAGAKNENAYVKLYYRVYGYDSSYNTIVVKSDGTTEKLYDKNVVIGLTADGNNTQKNAGWVEYNNYDVPSLRSYTGSDKWHYATDNADQFVGIDPKYGNFFVQFKIVTGPKGSEAPANGPAKVVDKEYTLYLPEKTLALNQEGFYNFNGQDIYQKFDGGYTTTDVEDVFEDQIVEEGVDAEPIFFNLQGQRVVNPEKGLYIVVKGNKTYKVMIK